MPNGDSATQWSDVRTAYDFLRGHFEGTLPDVSGDHAAQPRLAGSGAESQQGSGIGLAICKKVVEGHSGRIWAETNDGGGTVVHFTIPTSETA